MKLHFSIPAAEELREGHGGRYVLYSLFLEGFLLGKARYRQLRRWDEQLRQVFGSAVPAFPPKFYLAMTQSMADERRSQLEQYLQKVTLDANITKSEVFINFFRKLQLATFKIQTQRAFLGVYLADGSNITLDIQTSDTAERILQGEGRSAIWSRGVPIVQNTVWDPALALKQMVTLNPCMEINWRVAWDPNMELDDPLVLHPGLETSLMEGIPFGLVLLPNTMESMEMSPPDVEEPMEVDPPQPEQTWSYPSMSLLPATQVLKQHCSSVLQAPYSSHRLHPKL